MRLRGGKSVRLAARWLRSRAGARALVLGYHRVAEDGADPFSMCVRPDRLAEHLTAIRNYGRPVALRELVRGLRDGEPVDRAVAVTFDDGYADFLTGARPLLVRHRIPATVFVVAGLLGEEFWWDALWRILRPPRDLPDHLRLRVGGITFEWKSPGGARDSESRRELLDALYHRLFPIPEEARRHALGEIADWAGAPFEEPRGPRVLPAEGVAALAREEGIEVGAHSLTHPILPTLSRDRQRLEIQQSKAELEALVGRPVVSFSYPNGRASEETVALVRESGYEYACTSRNDVVRGQSDPFDLPRFWASDWDGARFGRWLERWLGRP